MKKLTKEEFLKKFVKEKQRRERLRRSEYKSYMKDKAIKYQHNKHMERRWN